MKTIKNLVGIIASSVTISFFSGCSLFGFDEALKLSGVCEQIYGKEECKKYKKDHAQISYEQIPRVYYFKLCCPGINTVTCVENNYETLEECQRAREKREYTERTSITSPVRKQGSCTISECIEKCGHVIPNKSN